MLLALGCGIAGWARRSQLTLAVALLWLYLSATDAVSTRLIAPLERDYPPAAVASLPQAEAIVLLGGGIRSQVPGTELPDLNQRADRLLYAAALYRAGKSPVLLLTGGGSEGAASEASLMRDALRVMGVPEQAMWLEERSRDTHGNAVFTAQMLKSKGIERVLLVTSAFHMRRSSALFNAQGITAIPAPTDFQGSSGPLSWDDWVPSVGNLYRTTVALHERVGYQVYKLRGWL